MILKAYAMLLETIIYNRKSIEEPCGEEATSTDWNRNQRFANTPTVTWMHSWETEVEQKS